MANLCNTFRGTLPCLIQKIIKVDTFNCCPMPPCSRLPHLVRCHLFHPPKPRVCMVLHPLPMDIAKSLLWNCVHCRQSIDVHDALCSNYEFYITIIQRRRKHHDRNRHRNRHRNHHDWKHCPPSFSTKEYFGSIGTTTNMVAMYKNCGPRIIQKKTSYSYKTHWSI